MKAREVHLRLAIANEIKAARTKAGLTQEQLAHLIGTTQSSVARAERGKMLVASSYLLRVARATNHQLIVQLQANKTI